MAEERLPRIKRVSVGAKPMTLWVQWDNGRITGVDVSSVVDRFKVYAPLRHSPELFGKVQVGEYGTDIVWTDEIDMSADTLWRLAREQMYRRIQRDSADIGKRVADDPEARAFYEDWGG